MTYHYKCNKCSTLVSRKHPSQNPTCGSCQLQRANETRSENRLCNERVQAYVSEEIVRLLDKVAIEQVLKRSGLVKAILEEWAEKNR